MHFVHIVCIKGHCVILWLFPVGRFKLVYTIVLEADSIKLTLTVENTGEYCIYQEFPVYPGRCH